MKRMAGLIAIGALLAISSPVDAGGRPSSADLSGLDEAPPNDLGSTGTALVTLNQGQNEICVDVTTSGITTPVLAGHIHAAPAGANGPVVVDLGIDNAQFSGCVEASAELIKAIRQQPGQYDVNVHTLAVQSGEVRGQLSK